MIEIKGDEVQECDTDVLKQAHDELASALSDEDADTSVWHLTAFEEVKAELQERDEYEEVDS